MPFVGVEQSRIALALHCSLFAFVNYKCTYFAPEIRECISRLTPLLEQRNMLGNRKDFEESHFLPSKELFVEKGKKKQSQKQPPCEADS
jgi:hypothetical protein